MRGRGKDNGRHKRVFGIAAAVIVVMLVAGILGILFNSGKSTMHLREKNAAEDKEIVNKETGDKKGGDNNADSEVKKQGDYQVKRLQNVDYPEETELMQGKNREPDNAFLKNLLPFYKQTMLHTLLDDKKQNMAYSPINLYLCMAMLSEMTDGQTRQQLFDALGQDSPEDVRKQSQRIWNSIYSGSRISKCILADSVWLRDDIPYDKDVLKILADNYYTSVYQGKMGTKSMDQEVQKWVNRMTGNLLEEQVGKLETHKDTILMLLSTVDFYDQWVDRFSEENTKQGVFYNEDGEKAACDFMKRVQNSSIYKEKRFSSISLYFESGRSMNIFLPEEGVSVEEMLQKDMKKILGISSGADREEAEYGEITLQLPKFQITTEELDLIPVMKKLGIKDLFLPERGDFSKILGQDSGSHLVYVDKAEQATKVAVDENGCSVASYTVVEMRDGAGMPDKKYQFNCNRSFVFIINNKIDGIPIFAGVVRNMG